MYGRKSLTKDCATVRVVKASGRLLESILVVLKSIGERERIYSRLRRQKKIKKLLISRRLSKH